MDDSRSGSTSCDEVDHVVEAYLTTVRDKDTALMRATAAIEALGDDLDAARAEASDAAHARDALQRECIRMRDDLVAAQGRATMSGEQLRTAVALLGAIRQRLHDTACSYDGDDEDSRAPEDGHHSAVTASADLPKLVARVTATLEQRTVALGLANERARAACVATEAQHRAALESRVADAYVAACVEHEGAVRRQLEADERAAFELAVSSCFCVPRHGAPPIESRPALVRLGHAATRAVESLREQRDAARDDTARLQRELATIVQPQLELALAQRSSTALAMARRRKEQACSDAAAVAGLTTAAALSEAAWTAKVAQREALVQKLSKSVAAARNQLRAAQSGRDLPALAPAAVASSTSASAAAPDAATHVDTSVASRTSASTTTPEAAQIESQLRSARSALSTVTAERDDLRIRVGAADGKIARLQQRLAAHVDVSSAVAEMQSKLVRVVERAQGLHEQWCDAEARAAAATERAEALAATVHALRGGEGAVAHGSVMQRSDDDTAVSKSRDASLRPSMHDVSIGSSAGGAAAAADDSALVDVCTTMAAQVRGMRAQVRRSLAAA